MFFGANPKVKLWCIIQIKYKSRILRFTIWEDISKWIIIAFIFHFRSRVVLYASGIEIAFLKFNASATNHVNWFLQNMVLQSQSSDLKTTTNIYEFSIPGNLRYLDISGPYDGCEKDIGWFFITPHRYCTWKGIIPTIIYSKLTTSVNWNDYCTLNCKYVKCDFAKSCLLSFRSNTGIKNRGWRLGVLSTGNPVPDLTVGGWLAGFFRVKSKG